MNVACFDYDLPPEYIAQTPAEPRDSAKLLRLDRETGALSHHVFSHIVGLLQSNDVLVLNNTRVLPARLTAVKADTGGKVEVLLLRQLTSVRWLALVGGRNVRAGSRLAFAGSEITCVVVEQSERSQRVIEFSERARELIVKQGEAPLPPYIHAKNTDSERYQTVYAEVEGSAAAPTAGLHFTAALLDRLREKGIGLASCTLHIGLDTFQPVAVENARDHKIHSEYAALDKHNADIINAARQAGGRIVAIGTTSARTLETAAILAQGGDPADPPRVDAASPCAPVAAFACDTSLFIYPGYRWRAVDALITNFHLPRSTLLMMLCAFANRERVLRAYAAAKAKQYRFYSFGDAMLVT